MRQILELLRVFKEPCRIISSRSRYFFFFPLVVLTRFVARAVLLMSMCLFVCNREKWLRLLEVFQNVFKSVCLDSTCLEFSLLDGGLYTFAGLCVKNISFWMAWRQTVTFVNKRTKCSSRVLLCTFSTVKLHNPLWWYSSIWCKACPASVIKNHYTPLSISAPLAQFLCSTTVIMKGISMSFCAKVQRTCLLCSPKPICHAYFIQCACITFDCTLISYFPNVFCHFSCFMKSYLHKHILNIHTSGDAPDCSDCSSQMRLNSKVRNCPHFPWMEISSIEAVYGNKMGQA